MSEKKLSFGFTSKIVKKINIIPIKPVNLTKSVQLIDCLEGQNIKIKNAVVEEKHPLIIPIQSDNKNLVERVIAAKRLKERSKKNTEVEAEDNRPDSDLSLDELAARQLIREAKIRLEAASNKNGATKIHVVPAIEDTLILEGSKEPTLDDYENVPIVDYGMAMLRGMGWSESKGIGKDKKSTSIIVPELRPKGMGLGAYKMIEEAVSKQVVFDKDGQELSLVKGASAKIIAGKEKGFYCKVEGLDDDGGRIIVKMAIKGTILSLNEFMLCPVTTDEYSANSRILNNSKYRDFQKREAALLSDLVNAKSNASTSKEKTSDSGQRRTEIKQEQKKKSRRTDGLESSSPDNYGRNVKKERDRSRSRSVGRRQDRRTGTDKKEKALHTEGNIDRRKYRHGHKSRSKSPSCCKTDKESMRKISKYRRSRSNEKYNRIQEDAKKHEPRKSKSYSPPRSSNKYSRNQRSRSSSSSSIDYSRRSKSNKSKYSNSRYRRSSSSSSAENISKTKDHVNKSKISSLKLDKNKRSSGSELESDYEDKKEYKKNKKTGGNKKDKKTKSSAKYNSDYSDDHIKVKSHSKKKKDYSSESDRSDDVKDKKRSSKRR